MKFILVLIILIFQSCTKYSDYKSMGQNTASIIPEGLEIYDYGVISWKVGKNYRQEVSKGFRIQFKLPSLEDKDLDDLVNKKGVDSWVLKVIQDGVRGKRVLGYVYYPLAVKASARQTTKKRQVKAGAVSIYYASASMSRRFENFKCPAFNHSKEIDEIKLYSSGSLDRILVSAVEDRSIGGKVESYGIAPAVFNGEMVLRGRYTFALALYNSAEKKLKSNFTTIPQTIEVVREIEKEISGCSGFTVPEKEKSEPSGGFQFGQ